MSWRVRRFSKFSFLFLILVSIGLAGCDGNGAREFCSTRGAAEFREAMVQLEPLKSPVARLVDHSVHADRSSRSPASIAGPVTGHLSPSQQEHWENWAETRLKRFENWLDFVSLHQDAFHESERVQEELSGAANELVAFQGECQQERVDRMITLLKRLEQRRRTLAPLVCQGLR